MQPGRTQQQSPTAASPERCTQFYVSSMIKLDRRYLHTTISIIICVLLTIFLWHSNQDADYVNLANSIFILFSLIAAFIAGTITIVLRYSKSKEMKTGFFYNFAGTFNICASIVCCIFLYSDGADYSKYIMCIIPFGMGIFILYDIFISI